MADPSQNLIGGRYEILTPLGKGGMGVVYKAYDPVLDRTVAIKKMASNIVDHDEFRQRFFVEARAVARLNHPNIVTIHELEEDEGGIYIVMEMLDGVSLSAVMKHGDTLSRDAQVTLLAKVCSGLDYAHVRGVIHRDIKPANLMLTTSGGVKILDFGIARFATSEMTSMGGTMLGTPHYMSPEQIEGRPVDARADWFSFGAVAYELIARMKPFDAPSVPPLLMKITNQPHTSLIDIAPDTVPPLSAIVDRLLAKDRDQRPSSGADVQCALNASGDTNREDLIAAVVKSVLGDSGDATIIAPLLTRGTTSPLIAARPSAPPVIPSGTGTTPVGLGRGPNAPGTLAPSDPTLGVPSGTRTAGIAPSTVAYPPPTGGATPVPASPLVPANTATAGLPTLPNVPPSAVAMPPAPVAGAPAVGAPVGTPVGAAGVVAPSPAHQPVAAAAGAGTSDIPAARSSLKGALIVVLLLIFFVGLSGVGAIWYWVSYTDSGKLALGSILGNKPVTTTASSTTTSSPSTTSPSTTGTNPSTTTPTTSANPTGQTTPSATDTPSSGSSTPSSTPSTGTPVSTSDSKLSVEASTPSTPSTGPSTTTPSSSSTPSSSTGTQPTTPSTGAALPTPPRPIDAPPPPTGPRTTTEPRTPVQPRNDPRRTATADPLPPEHGTAPPPPSPGDDAPRVTGRDTRAPLDESTVNAFKGSRGSSTPSGYGNIDSPMNAASVVRIKDTLDSYSQAIEKHDMDTLHTVREPLTPAESAQAQSATPTLVRFSEVEVHTDGKTASVVARRSITVGGQSKFNGFVEIRMSRRPQGWVITDIR